MAFPYGPGAAPAENLSVSVRNVTLPSAFGRESFSTLPMLTSASSGRCQPTTPGPEIPGVAASTVDSARPASLENCSSGPSQATPRKVLMPAARLVGFVFPIWFGWVRDVVDQMP